LTSHYNKLKNIFENSLVDQDIILIITNTSVKNTIAILISYICKGQVIITKFVHYAINITSMEAKLFVIRCRINQVVQLQDIAHIIVITDAILAAKQIFDTSIHPYQLHSITISKDFGCFFKKNPNNVIVIT